MQSLVSFEVIKLTSGKQQQQSDIKTNRDPLLKCSSHVILSPSVLIRVSPCSQNGVDHQEPVAEAPVTVITEKIEKIWEYFIVYFFAIYFLIMR